MVESQPSKLLVAGSIPVSRSIRLGLSASLMAGRQGLSNALSERSEPKGTMRRKVGLGIVRARSGGSAPPTGLAAEARTRTPGLSRRSAEREGGPM